MKIYQLNCQYSPEEDRVLFRVSTDEGVEGQYWLTQRLVKGMWPHLPLPVDSELKRVGSDLPMSRNVLMAAQRQVALETQQFDHSYEAAGQQIPAQQLLIMTVRLTPLTDGGCVLAMSGSGSEGVELTLPPDLWHGLLYLLEQVVEQAGWSLPPLMPTAGTGCQMAIVRH